ncbi:MAG TPA: hypothetical protein VMV19_18185 [Xanthobacteraceae bacterium]|nr:hypothetical protein [Xanthobacteraceae bacterium]
MRDLRPDRRANTVAATRASDASRENLRTWVAKIWPSIGRRYFHIGELVALVPDEVRDGRSIESLTTAVAIAASRCSTTRAVDVHIDDRQRSYRPRTAADYQELEAMTPVERRAAVTAESKKPLIG